MTASDSLQITMLKIDLSFLHNVTVSTGAVLLTVDLSRKLVDSMLDEGVSIGDAQKQLTDYVIYMAKDDEKEEKNDSDISDEVEDEPIEIELSRSKYPETAKHIEDAIKNGHPDTLTINRKGAKKNRKESLKGIDKVSGKDLDEYPPAMFEEGGEGASVRPINSSDNRGAGSTIGHLLRGYPDGTKIRIKIIN